MSFFGKSEAELNKIAANLDKRQTDLDNRESSIKSKEANLAHERDLLTADREKFETERSKHANEVKRIADSIAAERADLEGRRSEIALLEAKAKANFADAQRQVFKEVVEKRQAELDGRQRDLDALATDFAERLETFHAKEGDLAKREIAVTEREQKADAGFADKVRAIKDETSRQHKANQDEVESLRKLADAIVRDRKELENAKAALTQREQEIIIAEQKRDAGFADERASVQKEIAATREKKLAALEEEIATLRTKRLENEQEAWTKQQDNARKQLNAERAEFEKHKGALSALQSEIEGQKVELEAAERMLERKEQRLEQQLKKRNQNLDDEVDSLLEEARKSMESQKEAYAAENSRLRESLAVQTGLLGAFEQMKQQFGGNDPAEILRELNSKTDLLKRLREELNTRPTEEMRERYQALESEARTQKARADELAQHIADNNAAVAEVSDLRRKNSELNADNKSLAQKASRFEGAANEAQAELNRLRAAYERPAEIEARYKEIEMPHIKADKIVPPIKDDSIDEITWLTGVSNACDTYGLHFHPRILKAFHTALKTAEWSPLTILAGVSGTGKSELPRLYSHFGGLIFEPLSVQPNWDSQESMLGFFNSIDNKFDTQPVLRFLAQSQKQWIEKTLDDEGYPGLLDVQCLILLDEMNLAHPELYFAEFLSKLELRRGMKGTEVPRIPVKIGAGMPPYQLPLGRNVLWTGTMNQDETTKSLSDKVLDRSIIIHFPRPTELKRRLKLAPLDEKNRGPLLHKSAWQKWLAQGSVFSDDNVTPFRSFIQEMNAALALVGRAIGHRVWQSVEYYMANYPDVRAAQKAEDKTAFAKAMHTAFEDQLVQKVMPKLRGIDTRGKSKTGCLDKIRGQIVAGIGGNSFNLAEDFDLACELGYGQFIWQTANYLGDSEANTQVLATASEAGPITSQIILPDGRGGTELTNDIDLSQPPTNYHPGSSDRYEKWNKLQINQKRLFHQRPRAGET